MRETPDSYWHGGLCWSELMPKDQQTALDFYRDLLGWQGKPDAEGHAVCELNGKAVAGVGPWPVPEDLPGPRTAWLTYLAGGMDITRDRIVEAGGTVLTPAMAIGNLSEVLWATDPQGAAFGVWQYKELRGAGVFGEAGAQVFSELHTTDVKAAAAFYGKAFIVNTEPLEGDDSYWAVRRGEHLVGGITQLSDDQPDATAHWLTYFAVDDIDSTVDALVKRGGTLLAAPSDTYLGRKAVVTDPNGASFALLTPKPSK
ncbi:VOC family protein [Streptomyces diastaticus]|uniref:VOC family protein n=1 Tax=Streptomyces diastaticus TaxID=1956 RepID=UPI0033EE24CA